MTRYVFALLVAIVLGGCADSYNIIRQSPKPNVTLSPRDSFYISISRNGVYGDEEYPGSGRTLSQAVLSSFAKFVRRIDMANTVESYDEAMKTMRAKNYEYLVFPTILHWENHATEWNGISDKVKVKIEIVRAEGETIFDSVIIEGKSGWATLGGDQPQDLLPAPIEEFVSGLFTPAMSQ